MTATLARVEAHVFRTPIKEPVRTSFGTMTERVQETIWSPSWLSPRVIIVMMPMVGRDELSRLSVHTDSA